MSKKTRKIEELEDKILVLKREVKTMQGASLAANTRANNTDRAIEDIAEQRDDAIASQQIALDKMQTAQEAVEAALGINDAQERRHRKAVQAFESREAIYREQAAEAVELINVLGQALAPNGRGPGARKALTEWRKKYGITS